MERGEVMNDDVLTKEQKWNEDTFKEIGKSLESIGKVIQQLSDTDKELSKRISLLEDRSNLVWGALKSLMVIVDELIKKTNYQKENDDVRIKG